MFTPRLRHQRTAAVLVIFLCLFPLNGMAETAAAPASAEVTIPTPAATPATDRKDSSGAAVALAAVGAGIAGMSCMMLMKQAQEATDQSQKNLMMMMAMQQCSQAAQSLANAAQNEKGKEGLTSPAVAPSPSLKTDAQPTPAATEAVAALPEASSTPSVAVADAVTTPTPGPTTSGVVPPSAFDAKPETLAVAGEVKLTATPVANTPNLIPEARVGFDDAAKAGETSASPASPGGGLLGLTSAGSATGPAANAAGAKDLSALLAAAQGARGGNKEAKGETHGEGAGGGEGKPEKAPDMDMNAMLAQLMGGGAAGGAAASDGPSNGVINLKEFASANGSAASEELPNIFQYASFRYRSLKKEGAFTSKKGTVASANSSLLKTPATLDVARATASFSPKAIVAKGKR